MNLGGKHRYGTKVGRPTLRDGLADVGLICATEADRIPAGALRYKPTDHVLPPKEWGAGAGAVAMCEGIAPDGCRPMTNRGRGVHVVGPD